MGGQPIRLSSPVVASRVADNRELERYEVYSDDALAGFVTYKRRKGLIAFIHTEIDPAFEGHGLGSVLVRAALGEAREQGMAVLPFCPFVQAFIAGHEDYLDLVPAAQRAHFGLGEAA
jgi:predicted GNAT family acetyltransferase